MSTSLLPAARAHVVARIAALERQLTDLDGDQAGETKSSAGDKFETSRERMQQERDRLAGQLAVMREHRSRLELAARAQRGAAAGFGSTVTLRSGERYLLATGLGKVGEGGAERGYVISLESPLGRALVGVRTGEPFDFRGVVRAVVGID